MLNHKQYLNFHWLSSQVSYLNVISYLINFFKIHVITSCTLNPSIAYISYVYMYTHYRCYTRIYIIFRMITQKQTVSLEGPFLVFILNISPTSVACVSSNAITKELGVGSWSAAAAILTGGAHARVVLIWMKWNKPLSILLFSPIKFCRFSLIRHLKLYRIGLLIVLISENYYDNVHVFAFSKKKTP